MRYSLALLVLLLLSRNAAASALGQLESLAGRSASSINVPMPSAPSGATGILSGAASGSNAGAALGALSMGLQLIDMLNSMNAPAADNTQQLQEQQRQELERQQALRRQSAEQLRSSWDQADAAHSTSVDGVFDVPIRSGTAFFSTPGNPADGMLPGQPAPAAPASSALASAPVTPAPSSAPATKPVSPPRQNTTSVQEMPKMTTEASPAYAEILAKGTQEFTRKAAKDILENALEKAIALLPNQWKADLIYEHQGRMRNFIDETFSHLDADRLVNTIAHGTPAEMAQLEQEIDRGTRESAKKLLGVDGVPGLEDGEPEFLGKIWRGETVTIGEAWGIVKGRIYSAGIDKATDRLFFGED